MLRVIRSCCVFLLTALACLLGLTKLAAFGKIAPGAHESWRRVFENHYAPQFNSFLKSYDFPISINHSHLRILVGSLEVLSGAALVLGSAFAAWTLSVLMFMLCLVIYGQDDIDALTFPLCITAMCLFVSITAPSTKRKK